jgi:hypothetical protein
MLIVRVRSKVRWLRNKEKKKERMVNFLGFLGKIGGVCR